ncbi:amidohydrolase family protein [Myxococcota bacterium]|nr:amidohydrolase family protein [Myxococcota bacterium]
MTSLLIRGGTVVDGTAAPQFRADVRIRDNRIAEVGSDLIPEPDDQMIDADGAFITPGFIDFHTHYDGPMWWMPSLDPMPGYGTTSVIMGNCGLSGAPMSAEPSNRSSMIEVFSYLEDIPQLAFENDVPWTWQSWTEYREALRARPTSANVAAFVGHLNLRIAAMGPHAWERNATVSEQRHMALMLEDGLRCGALGLSTNFFDDDANGRPVPSKLACDEEFETLLDVVARFPGRSLQFIPHVVARDTAPATLTRLASLCRPRGIRVHTIGVPVERSEEKHRIAIFEAAERAVAEGADVWIAHGFRRFDNLVNFERTLFFSAQTAWTWDEVATKTVDAAGKRALLQDSAWRARARHEWDHMPESTVLSRTTYWLDNSENGDGPTGITLRQFAEELELHDSDALAEWLLRNGTGSTITNEGRAIDEDTVTRLVHDPNTLTGPTDSGAHGQLFCGAGSQLHLLTHYVRNRGTVSIEQMVHALTGKIANYYGFVDRGVIAPGKVADLAVFGIDEIELRPEKRVEDVPDGRGGLIWRYTRDPAPMRTTIVGGVPIFDVNKGFLGVFPGGLIGPSQAA